MRSDGHTVSTVSTEALVDGSTRAVTQTNGVTFSVRDGGTGATGARGARGALDDSDSGSGEYSSDDRIEGSSRDDVHGGGDVGGDVGGGDGGGRGTYEKQDVHLVVGVKIAAYMRADRTAMRETWCVNRFIYDVNRFIWQCGRHGAYLLSYQSVDYIKLFFQHL